MHTIHKYIHLIIAILISICTTSCRTQSITEKYNETLRITEYYDHDGVMTGFSRYNKQRNTNDFYSIEGHKLRSEPANTIDNKAITNKKNHPSRQLGPEELEAVQDYRYEEINNQKLIREENPDLEHIGYYNLEGKLVAIKKYNRGTETWEIKFITPEKEK